MLYPLNMQYLQYLICTVATNLFFRIVKYIQVKEIIKKEKMKGRDFYPSIVDGGRSESEFTVNCEVRIFFPEHFDSKLHIFFIKHIHV